MADKFLGTFARLIADKPEVVRVQREDIDETFSEIELFVDQRDVGKLIGKNGKMISSLKAIISGCKAKEGRAYRVIVTADES